MTKPAAAEVATDLLFSEKEFYLDEFRGRTLVLALPLREFAGDAEYDALGAVARELLRNDTRVLLIFGGTGRLSGEQLLRRLQRRLGPLLFHEETLPLFSQVRGQRGRTTAFAQLSDAALADPDAAMGVLAKVWGILRGGPLLVGAVEDEAALCTVSAAVAERFGVHKLVLVEPQGGITGTDGQQLSFMDEPTLATLLNEGEAEWAGLADRRGTLRVVRTALAGGVGSVNLCSLAGLARELFTYEGSGTLFTLQDYCRVERLRIDEFEEVERLIERGQREGFLKFRSQEEISEILLTGYGATISTHHLAGVCALVTAPYADACAGEIVGLYTVTRFKGEGVGARLIQRVLIDAGEQGLDYVFACTTEERAQAFFERQGFRPVASAAVPEAKWKNYAAARRDRVAVYRLDISKATRS
ncbi:MAG: GNAT family N-acetyltransferase [Deltaproteobacteria bacterium]|nr:GNAT family N-acetyltransferase [Deltaproteobacteria bacterium]MBI3391149.1 GNAT family N-acetyltransferase [Deltaproteobacteria bacterium]